MSDYEVTLVNDNSTYTYIYPTAWGKGLDAVGC